MTLGEAAEKIRERTGYQQLREWQVRELYLKGRVPEPERLGRYRVVRETDLPVLEAALRAEGYLPAKKRG